MAEQFTGDFITIGTLDGSEPVVKEFDVVSGAAASIAVGDLVTIDDGNAGYVKKAADGASSALQWIGRCVKNSTDTTTAAGVVEVEFSPAGLIVRGAPTTASNLAQAIIGTRVTLDVTASVQTVDENDITSGVLRVLDYDSTSGEETIDVIVPCHLTYVS